MNKQHKAKYFQDVGWYYPAKEEHMIQWMLHMNKRVDGRLTYQYHKYQACSPYIRKSFDIALDIGAHVGTWSYYIAQNFNKLLAFEPIELHRYCWHKNVPFANALLYDTAVGNENKREVSILSRTFNSSGDTFVDLTNSKKAEIVPMLRLDDCPMPAGNVDFIKVDCEGYELFVLQGAEKLLKKYKPCVIVEQKPEIGGYKRYNIDPVAAVDYLRSLGAVKRASIQGDYILSWEK